MRANPKYVHLAIAEVPRLQAVCEGILGFRFSEKAKIEVSRKPQPMAVMYHKPRTLAINFLMIKSEAELHYQLQQAMAAMLCQEKYRRECLDHSTGIAPTISPRVTSVGSPEFKDIIKRILES